MRSAWLLAVLTLFSTAAGADVSYGAKAKFQQGRSESFLHFRLEYIGERRAASPQVPRGFVYQDFIVTTDAERVPLSWSAGTGDIAPEPFTIAGERFELELQRSDALGPLEPGELVITHVGPVELGPPAGARRLCGGHVTGVGTTPDTPGPHITWETFTSAETPESLTASYFAAYGKGNHDSYEACHFWRFPADKPRRILEVCPPEPPGAWRDCDPPPAGTRSIVTLSTTTQ
jgi:hypothetical protein